MCVCDCVRALGDWSFANTAAVVAEGTESLIVEGCSLHELGGNGLLIRGWNRGALISNSSFDRSLSLSLSLSVSLCVCMCV